MDGAGAKNLPRVLVTGFEPFLGAPVNPTAWLVEHLQQTPPALDGVSAFRAEVLPVDYRAIGPRLSEIGESFAPDIAIQFGLAGSCTGFRLERVARNRLAGARPDNAGYLPGDGPICGGPDLIVSTLPLAALHGALTQAGLPVEWSDDAGGYLCNVAMTLSLAHACEGFAPRMSGFIHVPPIGENYAMSESELLEGFGIILASTLDAWRDPQITSPEAN